MNWDTYYNTLSCCPITFFDSFWRTTTYYMQKITVFIFFIIVISLIDKL